MTLTKVTLKDGSEKIVITFAGMSVELTMTEWSKLIANPTETKEAA